MPKIKVRSALVTWTKVANATGYTLYWGTSPGQYGFNVNSGTTQQSVLNLERGRTYYFAVKAHDTAGASPYSKEVKFLA